MSFDKNELKRIIDLCHNVILEEGESIREQYDNDDMYMSLVFEIENVKGDYILKVMWLDYDPYENTFDSVFKFDVNDRWFEFNLTCYLADYLVEPSDNRYCNDNDEDDL